MPRAGAASTTRRTASAPARCPADRGSPWACAQRPLPSMMMATCIPGVTDEKVLCMSKCLPKKISSAAQRVPRRADERFHVRQVAGELPPAEGGELILRPGPAAIEALGARHVAGVLELAGVHAQVAVRRVQERLDLVECPPLRRRQPAHDAEPEAVMDEVVERWRWPACGRAAAAARCTGGRCRPLGPLSAGGARVSRHAFARRSCRTRGGAR